MTTTQKKSNLWNGLLWMSQVLLAVVFFWAGFMKMVQPEKLPFPWIKEHSTLVFITGVTDLLAGIGVLLPALFHFRPQWTILAAYGIMVLMITACIFHISRGEAKEIGFNIFVLLLAGFVAWGRRKKAPFNRE